MLFSSLLSDSRLILSSKLMLFCLEKHYSFEIKCVQIFYLLIAQKYSRKNNFFCSRNSNIEFEFEKQRVLLEYVSNQ